ncbi:hypothetical protein D043_4359A, partial [Vibrio parahaemolyticus EKP-021]
MLFALFLAQIPPTTD